MTSLLEETTKSRYSTPRTLTRWTDERTYEVLDVLWFGHRARKHKLNIEWIATKLDVNVGGLVQMLDKRYRQRYGAGGPIRGRYKTKKIKQGE
jgi:hypothetical protein